MVVVWRAPVAKEPRIAIPMIRSKTGFVFMGPSFAQQSGKGKTTGCSERSIGCILRAAARGPRYDGRKKKWRVTAIFGKTRLMQRRRGAEEAQRGRVDHKGHGGQGEGKIEEV